MANEYAVNAEDLARVAEAIRQKGETEAALAFPDGFVSAVSAISTGAELNYSVTAYESENELPQTADENTIAVITDKEITAHVFATEEPQTPAEGLVWFETGAAGKVYFAATADGSIYLYPSKAKQYVSGAWASKAAKIYQNGWIDWSVYLFEQGNGTSAEFTLTGTTTAEAGWNVSANRILYSNNSDIGGAGVFSPKVSGYSKLCIDMKYTARASATEILTFGLSSNTTIDLLASESQLGWSGKTTVPYSTTRQTAELNITGKTGYVKFHSLGTAGEIYNIWLE